MWPDPDQRSAPGKPGTIIYIGDVRKRRRPERRAPDRYYLAALLLLAMVSWAVWLAVLFTVTPTRLVSYAAFLAPLGVALLASGSIASYGVQHWLAGRSELAPSVRRGVLLAVVAIANLAFLAARHWGLPILGVTVIGAILADVAAQARR